MTETQTAAKTPAVRKTTAKKAPVTKAAPAKTTPAKAAPQVATTTAPAARKLRWQVEGDRNAKGGKEQSATVEGFTYAITRAGEGWTATVTIDGKATLLVTEGKVSAAYVACVKHNRERA
jgi:hypothetical protein